MTVNNTGISLLISTVVSEVSPIAVEHQETGTAEQLQDWAGRGGGRWHC